MGLEPDLYPLLASSQVRARGPTSRGYQDAGAGHAAGDRPEARRRPTGGSTAWRELLAGLAARQPLLPIAWHSEDVLQRGVEGPTPRLIAGPGDRFWDVLAWRLAADR